MCRSPPHAKADSRPISPQAGPCGRQRDASLRRSPERAPSCKAGSQIFYGQKSPQSAQNQAFLWKACPADVPYCRPRRISGFPARKGSAKPVRRSHIPRWSWSRRWQATLFPFPGAAFQAFSPGSAQFRHTFSAPPPPASSSAFSCHTKTACSRTAPPDNGCAA